MVDAVEGIGKEEVGRRLMKALAEAPDPGSARGFAIPWRP